MWIRESDKVAELTEGAGGVPGRQMVLPCSNHFLLFTYIRILAASTPPGYLPKMGLGGISEEPNTG